MTDDTLQLVAHGGDDERDSGDEVTEIINMSQDGNIPYNSPLKAEPEYANSKHLSSWTPWLSRRITELPERNHHSLQLTQ